jgi:hypothetical protein
VLACARQVASILRLDLVHIVLGNRRYVAARFPPIQFLGIRANPRLEENKIFLALLVGFAKVLTLVSGLATDGAFPVVKLSHDGTGVGPTTKKIKSA